MHLSVVRRHLKSAGSAKPRILFTPSTHKNWPISLYREEEAADDDEEDKANDIYAEKAKRRLLQAQQKALPAAAARKVDDDYDEYDEPEDEGATKDPVEAAAVSEQPAPGEKIAAAFVPGANKGKHASEVDSADALHFRCPQGTCAVHLSCMFAFLESSATSKCMSTYAPSGVSDVLLHPCIVSCA